MVIIVPTALTFSKCAGTATFHRQSHGDDPHYCCQFVDAKLIKMVVHECIPIINEHECGTVANARQRLSAISQLPIFVPIVLNKYYCDG